MINGMFELIGSMFLLLNVLKLNRDREVKGVSWVAVGFFFLWGLWNLKYYPSLNQWWSFAGGCCIAVVNLVWLAMLIWYSRRTKAGIGDYTERLEDALCTAICIIQHDAGLALMDGRDQFHETRSKWADELIDESGIDFESALSRTKGPE